MTGPPLTRRQVLALGAASAVSAAAGAVLGTRRPSEPVPGWPTVVRDRPRAPGPDGDPPGWYRGIPGRAIVPSPDGVRYLLPTRSSAPHVHTPEYLWRLDAELADVDGEGAMAVSRGSMRAGVLVRGDGFARAYAATTGSDGLLRIARHEPLRAEVLAEDPTHAVVPGRPFRVRLVVEGTDPVVLRARSWPAGEEEPGAWHVLAEDGSSGRLAAAGTPGIVIEGPGPGEDGDVVLSELVLRSTGPVGATAPRIVYALAGPPTPDGPGTYRVPLRVRTTRPAEVRVTYGPGGDPVATTFGRAGGMAATAHVAEIADVPAGSPLSWQAVARSAGTGEEAVGPEQDLRVPPGPGEPVSFCFGSCTFPQPPHRSFATAASLRPDFFVHLGDLGYPHSSRWAAGSQDAGAYVDRWSRLLAEPSFRELHRVASVVLVQDDHDYGLNNCWVDNCPAWSARAFGEIHANPGPDGYFGFRWGDVEVFVVDVRRHSDDPAAPDGPGKSRLGEAQKRWLLAGMEASDARLLVVASPSPIRTRVPEDPSWETVFAHEREELIRAFASLPRRVVVVSGDAHGTRVMRYEDPGGSGRIVYDHLCAGTEQSVDVGKRVDIFDPDGVTDPERNPPRRQNAFGHVRVADGRVTMRSLSSETGRDLFPPLVLPLLW
ncbi:MAG: alkaline phosphatase D family protein [Actinobacteria bacterium]|nr:alkaline phosphatase D family protein [Actinomycetota bacterium]